MKKFNKKSIRRIVSFLCAFCLLVSGEGSYCATALGAMLNEKRAAAEVSAETNIDTAAEDNGIVSTAIEAEAVGENSAAAETGSGSIATGLDSHAMNIGTASNDQDTDGMLVDGIEFADAEGVSIAAADGSYLPEDARSRIEVLTGQDEENAVASIEEYLGIARNIAEDISDEAVAAAVNAEGLPGGLDDQNHHSAVTYGRTQYAVFDISLDNVDADAYANGFWVEVVLPTNIVGRDYHLYHIHDGVVAEIEDVNVEDGILRFITPNFSQFVLGYTVDFHWGEYVYSLDGDGEILLSSLLQAISIDQFTIEDIKEVTFSNPELLDVKKLEGIKEIQSVAVRINNNQLFIAEELSESEIITEDETVDTEALEAEATSVEVTWNVDWLLTSLKSFESEESLSLKLNDGSVIEILVTDPTTVTSNGFTYSINNQKTAATITRRAAGYTNLSKTAILPDKINNVPVTSAPYTVFPAGSSTLVTEEYVNLLFPSPINVPQLIVTNDDVAALESDPDVKPGDQNSTSMTQVWKKSTVNADGNLEITLSFFQKQGKPIDFILVCDETGSMANAATATVGSLRITSPRFMWARAAILKATRALLDANDTSKYNPAYSNNVAFLVWDNRAQLYSGFYNRFDDANNWMKNQYTGHNGTNHTQTITTLLNMIAARKADNAVHNRDAAIVVVYLSDFADGGYAADYLVYNGVRDTARNLLNANCTVYGLNMFGGNVVNSRQQLISRQGHNYVSGSDPSRLLPAFEQIINDAISNADSGMSIVDELSPAIKGQAETNKSSLNGGGASNPNDDTSSEAATYDDGKLEWDLSNGQTTNTIEGETVTTTKPLKTGQVYHKTITIPITDEGWGDNAYAGSVPTNGGMTLVDKNGNPINSVTEENSPIAKTPVKFKLGIIDTAGEYTENVVAGVQFTIAEQGSTDIKTFTTDNNGIFSVPYSGTNSVAFEKGKTYVLTEVVASVDSYNQSEPVHMIHTPSMPGTGAADEETIPSHWLLTVNDDYTISTAVQDAEDAIHTPPITVSGGILHIWNDERVDAKLIPITVQKVWDGDGPHFAVPFTIYGVDGSDSIALTAFSTNDEATAQVVTELTEADKVTGTEKETWSREVYVFSKSGSHVFYTSTVVPILASGHTYTPAQDNVTKLETEQTYSYRIEEGDYPSEYQYGYYVPSIDALKETEGTVTDVYKEYTAGSWSEFDTGYFEAQLHINICGFKLLDDITYGNSPDDYRKNAANTMHTPRNLYKHLKRIEMELECHASNVQNVTQAKIYVGVSNVPTDHDGVLFQNIRLPKEWEETYVTDNGSIGTTHACNYTEITIKKLTFVDDKDNHIVVYGGNNELGDAYQPVRNTTDNNRLRLAIEKNGTNTGSHAQTTVTNSVTGFTSRKYTAGSSTDKTDTYHTKFITLGMTNKEIPLVETDLTKVWELDGHSEQIPLSKKLGVTVYGKNSGGSTGHVLPVYTSSTRMTDPADSSVETNRLYELTEAAHDKGDGTWSAKVYIPQYEQTNTPQADITGYTATEDELVVNPVGSIEGEPGNWEECEIKNGVIEKRIIDVEGRDAGFYPTATQYKRYLILKIKTGLVWNAIKQVFGWESETSVSSIGLTWKEGGVEYHNTINAVFTLDEDEYYSIEFEKSTTNTLNIESLYINGNKIENLNTFDLKEIYIQTINSYTVGSSIFAKTYQVNQVLSSSTNEECWNAKVDEVSHIEACPTLTLTNTFVGNKPVKITNSFTDGTDDSGSTDAMTVVHYLFTDTSNPSKTYELDVPKGGSATRYLPEGDYSVRQMGYKLETQNNVYEVTLRDDRNPYIVTITNATQQDDEKLTGDFSTGSDMSETLEINFKNERKYYPVTVQMEWHPELEADEDPLAGYTSNYTLRYFSVTGDGFEDTEETGVLKSKEPTIHDGSVPIFSVDGRPLRCELGNGEGVESLLPDYAVDIRSEEVDNVDSSGNIIEANPKRLIYTFVCDLKQTLLSINKTWQFDDEADKTALTTMDSQTVTIVLKRKDGKDFRIGDQTINGSVGKRIVLPTDGRKVDDLSWIIDIEDIDVSKSYLTQGYYILEETYVGDDPIASADFEPVYEDILPAEAHAFGTDNNQANFRLVKEVAENEKDPGTAVSVTNREITKTFTMLKKWKDIQGNSINGAMLNSEIATVGLYGVKTTSGGSVNVDYSSGDVDAAVTMLRNHANNNSIIIRDFGDYEMSNNTVTKLSDGTWSLAVKELPASYNYYAIELAVDGEALVNIPLKSSASSGGSIDPDDGKIDGESITKTLEADLFQPEYSYTARGTDDLGSVEITNILPYICKIEQFAVVTSSGNYTVYDTMTDAQNAQTEGSEVATVETPFATLNKALIYARGTNIAMDTTHPVTIQMLVDYTIPSNDTVTLDETTDNITLKTAPTSGGVYNFVDTFDGKVDDDKSKSVLKRGSGYLDTSMFTMTEDASAKLSFANIILDGDNQEVTCNGGIVSTSAGTLTVGNDVILRNSKASNGGAIYMGGGTLNVSGEILDCYATGTGSNGNGGAIYLASGVNATENGLLIDGHTALNIYEANQVVSGKTLTASEAAALNKVHEGETGFTSYSEGSVLSKTLTFEEADALNMADGVGAAANAVKGGGIYVSSGAGFTFTGGELVKCKARSQGGAIYNAGTVTMVERQQGGSETDNNYNSDLKRGTIEHCSAITTSTTDGTTTVTAGQGGGIYVDGTGTLTMTGGAIEYCTAYDGGGIYNNSSAKMTQKADGTYEGGAVDLSDDTSHPGIIDHCFAHHYGGGIYVAAGELDMTGGHMEDCYAGEYGGAIYDCTTDRMIISGVTIIGHKDLAESTLNAKKGGVIYCADGHLEVEDSYIYNFTAEQGGAVYHIYDAHNSSYNADGKELYLTNVTIDGHEKSGNYGTLSDAVPNATKGGVVYIFNGCNNEHNGHTDHNKKNKDGIIFAQKPGPKLVINGDSKIYDCTATKEGGVVYCDSPAISKYYSVTIQNATIDGHQDLSSAVKNAGTSTSTVDSNPGFGGAVYQHRGYLLIGGDTAADAVTIKNCTADEGGAVYNMGNAKNKTEEQNTDEDDPDAEIYNRLHTVMIKNVTIDGHDGMDAGVKNAVNGGAVFIKMGTLILDASTIRDNYADNGGAIYARTNNGGTNIAAVYMNNASKPNTIIDNTATSAGAGIYLYHAGSGKKGAGLYLAGNQNFGGSDMKGGDGDDADDLKGSEGNFVIKTGYGDKTNGGKDYPEVSPATEPKTYKLRQDIYINESPTDPASIIVSGDITSGAGSVWVWAEDVNHYEMLKPFAIRGNQIVNGVTTNELVNINEATYKAFRNARDDDTTGCGGEYLTGQTGDNEAFLYWTGGYDFSFLKVDGSDVGLEGATFTMYTKYEGPGDADNVTYQRSGADVEATSASGKTAGTNSLTYVNDEGETVAYPVGTVLFSKVAPRTYYLVESATPTGFTKNKDTVYQATVSSDGSLTIKLRNPGSDYSEAAYVNEAYYSGTGTSKQYRLMNLSDKDHKVILKKASGSYAPLTGAHFRIFRANLTEIITGDYDGTAKSYVSGDSGVYFIDRLEEGKYYVVETRAPAGYDGTGGSKNNAGRVFVLTVDENGGSVAKTPATTITGVTDEDAIVASFKTWAMTGGNAG